MPKIFISYRRDDSGGHAGRLYDRLVQHFGPENVFIDVDTIGPGVDFVEAVNHAVTACDRLIAVIGREWLTAPGARGSRRLDDPEDLVRLEIATAFERGITVIPLLVRGAQPPRSTELPDGLKELASRNALEVTDARFHSDLDRLIEELEAPTQDSPSDSMFGGRQRRVAQQEVASKSPALRVLMVEDSEDDAELLVRELRKGGYEPSFQRVDTAADMQAALDRQPWDLVLTDHNMPNFSALGALSIIQNRGLDLPFIIVSGTIGEDAAVAAMKAGAHDFIMKGNPARLIPAVERELREAEVRRTRRDAEQEERRLNLELTDQHRQLEQQVKELSGLNELLQQHLMQRSVLLKAYQEVREGLESLAQEAADLLEKTGTGQLPDIDGIPGFDSEGKMTVLFSDDPATGR